MRKLLGGLSALALVVTACGGAAVPDASGELVIDLSEFAFSPSSVEVVAGQTVTIVLNNVGDKEHEFMVGRDVNDDIGYPNGFRHNMFESIEPTVTPADAVVTDMGDMEMGEGEMGEGDMAEGDMAEGEMAEGEMAEGEMAEGDMAEGEMAEGEMGEEGHEEHGFMVTRMPNQTASITFTIPADAVGEWTIGCFEEMGAHWDDGMKGTFTVVEA